MEAQLLDQLHTHLPQAFINAENVLAFDWRDLTALGVAPEDARSIAMTLITKQLMATYWQTLRKEGVPSLEAKRIARAIAKYDVMETSPRTYQRELIRHYCPAICRAGLWRRELLLKAK